MQDRHYEELTLDPGEMLPAGTVVGGQYEIEQHLASGGMARVYIARQNRLDRQVAIKVLNHEMLDHADAAKRFYREAVTAAQLRHPNTVTVFDFGETDGGDYFLVMELLVGESLGERLNRERRLDPAVAIDIAVQVAESLSEAHACGIIHRDLKPDNIFLDVIKTDFVKVLDFGIAKFRHQDPSLTRLTRAGSVPGTPEYMSPEQCRGEDALDARSDLYSLGVVLYEMLAGRPPFLNPSPVVVMLNHVSEPVPPLPSFVPQPLASFLVCEVLAKDRAERPATAPLFIDALRAATLNFESPGGFQSSHTVPQFEAISFEEPAEGSAAEYRRTTQRDAASGHNPFGRSIDDSQEYAFDPELVTLDGEDDLSIATETDPTTTFMEFANPAVATLGDGVELPRLQQVLNFAMAVWNAVNSGEEAMDAFTLQIQERGSPMMARMFGLLRERKLAHFSEHCWFVESLTTSEDGETIVRAWGT